MVVLDEVMSGEQSNEDSLDAFLGEARTGGRRVGCPPGGKALRLMPVTDEQVAPLRAQLARQPEEHKRLFALLDQTAKNTGYRVLVSAAFVVAVERRFARDVSPGEVIEFVGDVRLNSPQVAGQVDPAIGERLIMAVFSGESLDDIDARKSWETQLLLMAAVVSGEHFDDAGLDAFLAEARKLADQWLT